MYPARLSTMRNPWGLYRQSVRDVWLTAGKDRPSFRVVLLPQPFVAAEREESLFA